MTALHRTLTLAIAAGLLATTGCGLARSPLTATAATAKGLAVRDADPWWQPTMLEDFESRNHRYDTVGDDNPFFNTPVGTITPYVPGGRVLEILAPEGEAKMRRGLYLTTDITNGEAEDDGHGSTGNPDGMAPHLIVGFSWANNGVAIAGTRAIYAEAIYLFTFQRKGDAQEYQAAIGYAWTNDQSVAGASWIRSSLNYGAQIPLRVLPIACGPGGVGTPPVPQACGMNALNGMVLQPVTRQLEKDVAQAYPDLFPAAMADAATEDGAAAGDFDWRYVNKPTTTAITAIVGLGGGCDLPQAVCSHAILDNFKLQRMDKTADLVQAERALK